MSFKKKETSCRKEIFEKYHEAFYEELHGWRDYELTSAGFEEWYYDCLPDDKSARILDLGCGDGKFIFYLEKKGYTHVEGLEISPQQAAEAKKHVHSPIHLCDDSLNYFNDCPETYDTITMNDVLEHVPPKNTIDFLRTVFRSLRPNGNLVVNVPQVSGFTSLFCRYNDFSHETLFTEMSLKQVLTIAGFVDIRFIRQKWPLKWTPRHLAFRLVRQLWYAILKLIYTIESPGERHPGSFQVRLVATACKPPRK